ncbi:MAG: signal peptidase II [Rhodobacteraceae bacterium]|nr:signal peptidase II [Paracoccaceae bacterium]MCY4196412.1 signal peptidase II [Paracoccaceae bacterium]MCY4327713.1 signal peptidase II [Paracoccaceae bacterium]
MMVQSQALRVTVFTAVAALAVDQLSKLFVLVVLDLDRVGEMVVVPSLVHFRMGWNTGVNFGLLAGDSALTRWLLASLGIGAAICIVIWSWQKLRNRLEYLLAGALAGGAAANGLDRVIHGAVVDFLNISCCTIDNPYVFNLADVAIVCGAAGLVVFGLFNPGKG